MTSQQSLLSTIDHLLLHIHHVKIFQQHWTLIHTYLTSLRIQLNHTHTFQHTTHTQLYHDIHQTLSLIQQLLTNSTENQTTHNGMTYRDIESFLLRLHIRLAQHQADLTDDYEMKLHVLTNAYHQQQTLIKKVFDETIKQRLQTLEQNTKQNTLQQLHLLHQKYCHIIKAYLHGCIQLHKSVPLSGINSDTVSKVAHTFYDISAEDDIKLKHQWQSCDLPLTRSFIQFKHDKSTSFERNQSKQLLLQTENDVLRGRHSGKELSKGIWQQLVTAPYMMSMIERDKYQAEEEDNDISEENIIKTKRWIVILGDPGCGKTSFTRWLTHHLAQTLLLNNQHSTDYGPLRIPILIRIGEYADTLKQHPSLSLFDYIGKHQWMGKHILADDASISTDELSCALQDYIRHGQALVILDGLDEIPASDLRSRILHLVEQFVDTYIQTSQHISVFDNNPQLNQLFDDPSRSGGNQIIVTSRIVGYHLAPLVGQFSHYTIRPMDIEHMKDFVDYWFFRVHQHILDILHLSSVTNQSETHAHALEEELEKSENSGLLDVASNACLMSFVCSVAFSQTQQHQSPLLSQRILLYESIVQSMLSLWTKKRSSISLCDLIHILSDIGTYIHGHSSSGLIHEHQMKQICIQSIKNSSGKPMLTNKEIVEIEEQACEFVRIIREDVGILAARGESLYGFLHLTFQEYFTCLKLIDITHLEQRKQDHQQNKHSSIAQSLRNHSNDPRFRVPIALALGKISLDWSQEDFDDFCLEFIRQEDSSSELLPIGAYMLISYGNDFVKYPSHNVLFKALDCLIIAAGQYQWSTICPFLFDQITNALRKFRHDITSLWIENFLTQSSSYNIQTVSALCHLIGCKSHDHENIRWLTQSSCLLLQSLLELDNEDNEYAIDQILLKVVNVNHRLLPISSTTFKEFLLTQEIDLNSLPVALFPLIITLYGGLKRDNRTVIFDPFYIYRESIVITPILIRFLSKKHFYNQVIIVNKIKQEFLNSLLTQIQYQDESHQTVELCIATICLCGIDYIRENIKVLSTSLLRKSMNRLKYISMILRQFYFPINENDQFIENETTKLISTLLKNSPYDDLSKQKIFDTLNIFRCGIARLRSSPTSNLIEGISSPDKRITLYLPNCLRKEYDILNRLLVPNVKFYSNQMSSIFLHQFSKLFWIYEDDEILKTQYRMAVAMDTIPEYLLFHNDEDILISLTYIPQHLQNLYIRLLEQEFIMIKSKDKILKNNDYLYFSHILFECLIFLSNTSCKRHSIVTALIALLPLLRMYHLENFASSLLWTLASNSKYSYYLFNYEIAKEHPLNYETGLYLEKMVDFPNVGDMDDEEQKLLIEKTINQEYERLENSLINNNNHNDNSIELYSACICLVRICQWTVNEQKLSLLEKCLQSTMLINNKLAQIDALCLIALYSHSDYKTIQINNNRSLQEEIEYQLNSIYSDLPLLLHSAIFIRCFPLLNNSKVMDSCLQNLFKKLINANQQDQHVVLEALLPYLQMNPNYYSFIEHLSNNYQIFDNKYDLLRGYLINITDKNLSNTLLISNIYLTELVSDIYSILSNENSRLIVSDINLFLNNKSDTQLLFQLESHILTLPQVLMITNIFLSNQSEQLRKFYQYLSDSLHRFDIVEFKACRLLESWMKWKDSDDLCLFTYHAVLLLTNSDFWSIEAATILCDLLFNDNDQFRQRAQIILRSENSNDIRTSSKLGIDVLLTLAKKRADFQHRSPSASLTLLRCFENTIIDIETHLEIFLWLERYRIHTLLNNDYSLYTSTIGFNFPKNYLMDVSFCDSICTVSQDLIHYLCNLIDTKFSLFLPIENEKSSDRMTESHVKFSVSILILLGTLFNDFESRPLITDSLFEFIETSDNNEMCYAAAQAFSYICDRDTHKILFDKISTIINNGENQISEHILSGLISSYCYSAYRYNIQVDPHDIPLFRKLLQYNSKDILNAVHIGLGRILKNNPLLFDLLNSDSIQCYHALTGATAHIFLYENVESSANIIADFIEQHSDLLPIFIVELYNSIRHFNDNVLYKRTIDYRLHYGYPKYVEIAGLIATRMPAAFCAFIKDWTDGENLKQALFYTSKQHNYPRRAACLTILSIFGELTVELCQMIIEGLHDDPHIQNTCYKCLTRINSIKDEKAVLDLLFSYLKSKSMNVRYVTVKILLHLSKSSLIPLNQVQKVLHDLMLDPDSNEELWLIEESKNMFADAIYCYAGSLKDVIYSLIIQHLTGEASHTLQRNVLNEIDRNFVESEKASRLSVCLFETNIVDNIEADVSTTTKVID